jgi:hypothetical protein
MVLESKTYNIKKEERERERKRNLAGIVVTNKTKPVNCVSLNL